MQCKSVQSTASWVNFEASTNTLSFCGCQDGLLSCICGGMREELTRLAKLGRGFVWTHILSPGELLDRNFQVTKEPWYSRTAEVSVRLVSVASS